MLTYNRKLRLRNLEIFMIFDDNISICYLVIEDLRRPLNLQDIKTTFDYMDEDDLDNYKNIIKVDIISDETLSADNIKFVEAFAHGLVEMKDYCTTIYHYKVDEELFEQLGVTEDVVFYQKLLSSINSNYDISILDLNKLMYLSQD